MPCLQLTFISISVQGVFLPLGSTHVALARITYRTCGLLYRQLWLASAADSLARDREVAPKGLSSVYCSVPASARHSVGGPVAPQAEFRESIKETPHLIETIVHSIIYVDSALPVLHSLVSKM